MRIAVLSSQNTVLCYMDSTAVFALQFYDDVLHNYVTGANSTYTFTCSATHEDSEYIKVGNKISFRFKNRDYYMDIIKTKQSNKEITATCLSLGLSMSLNELVPSTLSQARAYSWYYADIITMQYPSELNINELEGKTKLCEMDRSESMIKRIYRVTEEFGGELEFETVLNDDYTLNTIRGNVYLAYNGTTQQGIGAMRDDIVLRYGHGLDGITREIDASGLYTAVQPFGKNDMRLTVNRQVIVDGNIIYKSVDGYIYAVERNQQFPSCVVPYDYEDMYDTYTYKIFKTQADTAEGLYNEGLAYLKEISEPKVKYTMTGEFDCNIGDSVIAIDETFNPPLTLRARVTEQQISFTDKKRNKTTFENILELRRA